MGRLAVALSSKLLNDCVDRFRRVLRTQTEMSEWEERDTERDKERVRE